ncbi:MAG: aspartate kinase [Bacteroidia bacterium]|nr:aspartate kinase [Bacteroidia bacterium]MCC6768492.1 aspartate kinase [Bacteroidia bacterium]
MVIYKFGGASVKDADSVRNAAKIIGDADRQVLLVVSAMGKTTNKLEKIVEAHLQKDSRAFELTEQLKQWHLQIVNSLFGIQEITISERIEEIFAEIYWSIEAEQVRDFDFEYDQIVSLGEVLSAGILSAYLNHVGVEHTYCDARDLIRTDSTFREANVDWAETQILIERQLRKLDGRNMITQGFIAGTSDNYSTTLGREGSDYTAAILAYCANASEVIIWKDVPGVFNADPNEFPEAILLPELSYYDAIEQAYYGASIIHPKTIKPLQNKNIPLRVQSFVNPKLPGTLISETYLPETTPTYILKKDQVLLSITPHDFSFIAEVHLRDIFNLFHQYRVKINLMQNSALNFTVCMTLDETTFSQLRKAMEKKYRLRFNTNCVLFTIRHYTEALFARFSLGKEILMEQRSRNTVQFVYRSGE